jgi:hypothetical protein
MATKSEANSNKNTASSASSLPRNHVARGYNFSVSIEGKEMSFSKVSGMKSRLGIDSDVIHEGGRNDTQYKSIAKGDSGGELVLSHAVILGEPTKFRVGQELKAGVVVSFKSHSPSKDTKKNSYVYYGCIIQEISYSDLDANSNSLVMEDITISYQRMEVEA